MVFETIISFTPLFYFQNFITDNLVERYTSLGFKSQGKGVWSLMKSLS